MRGSICGWHTQSNSLRKWIQLCTGAFTSLRRKDNTIIKMWDAVDLCDHCSHGDGCKKPYLPFFLPSFSQQPRELILSLCKLQNPTKSKPKPKEKITPNPQMLHLKKKKTNKTGIYFAIVSSHAYMKSNSLWNFVIFLFLNKGSYQLWGLLFSYFLHL